MKYYRPVSFLLSFLFATVGIIFIMIPDEVLGLFNSVSPEFNLPESPLPGHSFYLVLASGYMYVVALLAGMMYRFPENRYFPLLLAHTKLASSVLSLLFFVFEAHYLIFAVNFLVDGFIASLVTFFYLKMGRTGKWASS